MADVESSLRRERRHPLPVNVKAGNWHLVASAHILLARASHVAKVNIHGSFQSLAAVNNTTVNQACR